MITRIIQKKIENELFKGKIIVVYGARQVGKTTLVKKIAEGFKGKSSYFSCENLSVQEALSKPEPKILKQFLGDADIIILDEAQKIENIGLILKVLIDTYPKMQIIATGSSSFDLANKINEPLTGRKIVFKLYPLSLQEIKENKDAFEVQASLERILRFGLYPEIFSLSDEESIKKLDEISSSYLFKDVLSFEGIKKSSVAIKLLQLLALQIGNEVNYNEIANKLNVNRITVEKYIDILEQCFIVFKLGAFSRNLRNEISRSVKVYFYDLGIRNALIKNFNSLSIRNDVGALWENFCIIERLKKNHYSDVFANYYFWRTYAQKEIDFIEERNGKLFAFEMKWGKELKSIPKEFLENYKESKYQTINRDNYWEFLMK